jgi:hypothetical protein
MRIYLTHCSKEKSATAKASGGSFSPLELYTEEGIQQFMNTCTHRGVNWAILSDHYGIFLPSDRRTYYEKPPATVTPAEEMVIIHQLEQRLSSYDEIWFYVRPETIHPFYERVLQSSSLHDRIILFQDLSVINGSIIENPVAAPDKKDIIKSVIFLVTYVATISTTAFLFLPKFWYLWVVIVLCGMLLFVNWHKQKTAYQCPNCSHIYEISFMTDLIAPHGVNKDGGWLLLRCPNCKQRRKTTVLKKIEPV